MATKSKLFKLEVDNDSNLVLQVLKEKPEAMGRVVVDQRRTANDENQWWYYDVNSNTLRTKNGEFCLDIDSENNLRVNPWYKHAWTQHFAFAVQSLDEKEEVLQIVPNPEKGKDQPTVNTKDFNGADNQLWEYETAHVEGDKHFFMLRNLENEAVMRIGGKEPKAIPLVARQEEQFTDGQFWWYKPAQRTIQCKYTEYALEAKNKRFHTEDSVRTNALDSKSSQQQWRFMLVSTKGKGVIGAENEPMKRVKMTQFHEDNNNIAFKIVH